jgi:hypothetical protein
MTNIADVLRPIGAGCQSTQLSDRERIAIKRILVPIHAAGANWP